MKFITFLLLASAALNQNAASAQPQAPAKPHPATHAAAIHATTASHGCAKVPDLSPKIPALPAGATCAKPLYTITTVPNVILTDISPLETPQLRDDLGIPTASTFSLAYIDAKAGAGALAAPHKWYSIQYSGYLADGLKFDSSYDKPDHEPLNFLQGPGPQGRRMVVVGMDTGIDGMRVGGKRRLFIPFQLGYGPAGNPQAKIPAKSWLIFDIELVAQNDTDPTPKTPPTPPTPPPAASDLTKPAPAAQPAPGSAPPTSTAPPATPPAPTSGQPAPAPIPPVTSPTVVAPKPR